MNSYPLLIHDHGLICNVLIIDDMRHGDSSTRVVFSYFLISMNWATGVYPINTVITGIVNVPSPTLNQCTRWINLLRYYLFLSIMKSLSTCRDEQIWVMYCILLYLVLFIMKGCWCEHFIHLLHACIAVHVVQIQKIYFFWGVGGGEIVLLW